MGKSYSWLVNRSCPLHKTQLVYIDKYKLGCTGKVGLGNKRTTCPHIEYISTKDTDVPDITPKSIVDRLKAELKNRDYSEEYFAS